MMRIKMLTIEAGPKGIWHPGDERTVPDDVGQALIDGRYAVRVVRRVPADVETADLDAPENASASPMRRRRGRG